MTDAEELRAKLEALNATWHERYTAERVARVSADARVVALEVAVDKRNRLLQASVMWLAVLQSVYEESGSEAPSDTADQRAIGELVARIGALEDVK